MALDVQRLKAKLEALKNPKLARKNGQDDRLWKPDEKATKTVRLIQNPYGEDPFAELHFHYGIGKGKSILCPKHMSGKTCPLCEFGYELYKGGDKETSKKLFSSQRIYALMVDRSEETPKVRWWGFGKEMYQYLLDKLISEDYGTYLDPVNGLDADITCEKKEGQSWARAVLTFRRKESRLAPTDKQIQELIGNAPRIDEIFTPLTTAEINERLSNWLSLTEKDGGETVKTASGTTDTAEDPPSGGDNIKDLDAAFERAISDDL